MQRHAQHNNETETGFFLVFKQLLTDCTLVFGDLTPAKPLLKTSELMLLSRLYERDPIHMYKHLPFSQISIFRNFWPLSPLRHHFY